MSTRNGPLARGVISSPGTTYVAQVPFNFTWLLKSIHLYNSGSAESFVTVQLVTQDFLIFPELMRATVPPLEAAHWYFETGLTNHDLIAVTTQTPPLHYWFFGAGLPGVFEPQLVPVDVASHV